MVEEVIEPGTGAACIIDGLGFRAQVTKAEKLEAGVLPGLCVALPALVTVGIVDLWQSFGHSATASSLALRRDSDPKAHDSAALISAAIWWHQEVIELLIPVSDVDAACEKLDETELVMVRALEAMLKMKELQA